MEALLNILQKKERRVIGIMSGTSLDAIDIADLTFSTIKGQTTFQVNGFSAFPLISELRQEIKNAMKGSTREICALHFRLGKIFANAVTDYWAANQLTPDDFDLIGSHGQTICHLAGKGTLQIGEADIIARLCRTFVIHDFRASDIAVGGDGAPLIPHFDALLANEMDVDVAFQNLGGIGNLTFISKNKKDPVIAFDTGPANILLNLLVEKESEGKNSCDFDGKFSRKGEICKEFLDELMQHPFLKKTPPRSTGYEDFGEEYLENILVKWTNLGFENILRTLVAFSAHSIFHAYKNYLPRLPKRIFLSGGGSKHPLLVKDLRRLFSKVSVELFSQTFGCSEDAKEAAAFAFLAHQRLNGETSNMRYATGATLPVCPGKLAFPK